MVMSRDSFTNAVAVYYPVLLCFQELSPKVSCYINVINLSSPQHLSKTTLYCLGRPELELIRTTT